MKPVPWIFLLAGLSFLPPCPAGAEEPPSLSSAILPAPVGQTNHGPGLVGLPGGGLLLCWYSGSSEANADSRILCSDSADGGTVWTPPRVVVGRDEQALGASAPNKSLGNVTLHVDGAGRLWLIYGVIQRWDWPLIGNVCRNWFCGRVDAKVSLDQGKSWSTAQRLDDRTGALPRGRPLHIDLLGDVLPLYREGAMSAFLRILDLAKWNGGALAEAGHAVSVPGENVIQPALVRQGDGKIRVFLRDSRDIAVRTKLFDPANDQWTETLATDLPNPGAAVDAFLDDGGHFVLVYNPSRFDRHTLALAWSDDGVHFRRGCDLVAENGEGDVAYPSVIRTNDGRWHVAYSSDGKSRIRHLAFDAAWLGRCLGF